MGMHTDTAIFLGLLFLLIFYLLVIRPIRKLVRGFLTSPKRLAAQGDVARLSSRLQLLQGLVNEEQRQEWANVIEALEILAASHTSPQTRGEALLALIRAFYSSYSMSPFTDFDIIPMLFEAGIDPKVRSEVFEQIYWNSDKDSPLSAHAQARINFSLQLLQALFPSQPLDAQAAQLRKIVSAQNRREVMLQLQELLIKIGPEAVPAIDQITRGQNNIGYLLLIYLPAWMQLAKQHEKGEWIDSVITRLQAVPVYASSLSWMLTFARQMVPLLATAEQKEALARALSPWWKVDLQRVTETAPFLSSLGWAPETQEDRTLFSLASGDLYLPVNQSLVNALASSNQDIANRAETALFNMGFRYCPKCCKLVEKSRAVIETTEVYENLSEDQQWFRNPELISSTVTYHCPKCHQFLRPNRD